MAIDPRKPWPRVRFENDRLVVVEFAPNVDLAVNRAVHAFARHVRSARLTGIIDVVPTIRTVALHIDPVRTPWPELVSWLDRNVDVTAPEAEDRGPVLDVPVRYGGFDGPDLVTVAAATGLTERQVIELHASVEYQVLMMGFLPGFAYMGMVPPSLRLPRRETPRTSVPTGTVAIAGELTGIYPATSPGGWHLVGRTDVRLCDYSRDTPFVFSTGARVRFVPTEASV